jgi:EAL domain-containing protein (putative c-di-GMP-specific phosphodiesterase class I)
VSVNISARSLEDSHLQDKVVAALSKWGLPSSYLELEIAESTVMNDIDRVSDVLSRLSMIGVRVAIDEFGTGFSSLTRLQQLPLTAIKVHRSFVLDIERDQHKHTIVRAAINLAHDLGYAVVAVGVESADAWHLLRALQCDTVQGHFFSRPQPAVVLEPLLREHCSAEQLAIHL